MTERRTMCPNKDCEHYGTVRRIMGGCDCGAALVAYKTPEQRRWDALSPTQRRLVGYMMLADLQADLQDP